MVNSRLQKPALLFVCPRWGPVAGGSEALIRAYAERLSEGDHFRVEVATTTALDTTTWAGVLPAGSSVEGKILVHRFDAQVPSRLRRQIDYRVISRPPLARVLEGVGWTNPTVRSVGLKHFVEKHQEGYQAIVAAPYFYGMTIDAVQAAPSKSVIVPCVHDEPAAYLKQTGDLLRTAMVRLFNSEVERDLVARIHGELAACGPVVGMGFGEPSAVTDPAVLRSRFGLSGDYLVYVGRAHPLKGVHDLVLAVQAHNRRCPGHAVKLVLAGGGDYRPPADPQIRAVGYVDEPCRNGLLTGALANISFSRMESLSLVLLESWLLGTPSIVDAAAPVLHWQVSRSGGGISVRDVGELTQAIQTMRNSDCRLSMAEAGRKFVTTEYTWERVMAALVGALPGANSPKTHVYSDGSLCSELGQTKPQSSGSELA